MTTDIEQEEKSANSKSGVAAVDRAFTILDAFTHAQPAQSLADLARNTGLYKSTILRLMGSLERFGYVRQMADGNYRLGSRLTELASVFQDAFDLRDYVEPILEEIVDRTNEGASFLIRDGDSQLCLFRRDGRYIVRDYHIRVGTRMRLDRGAAARLFRRFNDVPAARTPLPRYFSVSHGEVNGEMGAVAAPVFGPHEALTGVLQISSPVARFHGERVELLKTVSTEASVKLSAALGAGAGRFSSRLEQVID